MSEASGDAQATGMTEAQAAEKFMSLLSQDEGDGGASEPLKGEADEADPEAEAEEDAPEGDEPDAEEQSDDEDEAEEQPPEPRKFRVKANGEELEVTEDELVKGYARTQDYTQKTMAVAEERKTLEADRQALAAERTRTTELLKTLEQALAAPAVSPEDLAYLRENDPAQYAVVMADEMRRKDERSAVQAERDRLERQQTEERAKADRQRLQEEQTRLLEALPEWKDAKVAKADQAMIAEYGAKRGLTPEELGTIVDHRLVTILRDAAKFAALQDKAPKVKAKVEQVQTAKPGTAARQPSKVSEETRAKQRLAKTGRVEDAAAIFLTRLG